jgi:uncharacterized protein (DUF1697 family)
MAGQRYVALIRGINVGGKNLISMADLRAAFEAEGHEAVSTYIQSGNVLFESSAPRAALDAELEPALERHLGLPLLVFLRSRRQFRSIVAGAPDGFGQEPGTYHSDVIFLRPPLTAGQAMARLQLRDGVDRAWPGTGVVYFSRLSERRTQSRMGKIVGTPEYQLMSIRSWNTVAKLADLLEA